MSKNNNFKKGNLIFDKNFPEFFFIFKIIRENQNNFYLTQLLYPEKKFCDTEYKQSKKLIEKSFVKIRYKDIKWLEILYYQF